MRVSVTHPPNEKGFRRAPIDERARHLQEAAFSAAASIAWTATSGDDSTLAIVRLFLVDASDIV